MTADNDPQFELVDEGKTDDRTAEEKQADAEDDRDGETK